MYDLPTLAVLALGTPDTSHLRWSPYRIASVAVSVLFLVAVIELIRRNRLKEKYSILWLFSAMVLLVFSSSVRLLNRTSKLLGIDYPPSFLFLLAFVFLLFIVFHFSTVISMETERSKKMAQKLGLLENKVEQLEKELKEKKES